MSDKRCCVPGCKDSEGMHHVLHGFPNPEKESERFRVWLYAIGGDLLGLENMHIFKNRRVCHSHFEEKFQCRNNRISNIAVPTLRMPATSSNKSAVMKRKPMKEILNPAKRSTPSGHYSECSVHRLCTKMEGNTSHKENLDPVSPMQDPVISTNPLVINERGKMFLGGKLAVKKKTKRVLYQTKVEKELLKQIIASKIKISKMKNKIAKQKAEIKAAKKFATNPAVLEVLDNCSSTAKILMQLQWRENKKKEKGRRFTLPEKIAALSIFKQSPKGYRFFRKIFILPAPQTLIKLIQRSNLQPGLNKNIFSQLKNKTETMNTEQKLCILLFDEMMLKAHVTFNERKNKVIGFVDNGQQRKPEYADHAQVFMIRGLIHNYKQAVSYSFSSSATKGPELANQIKEVITEIQQAGLIVVATVCDQSSNNRQAIKLLMNETRGNYLRRGETPKDNIMLINNTEIIPLYDPPHLLKGIRNNLLTKNLNFTIEGVTKTAKWSHLQLLYKEDPGYKGIRLIPKLTEAHINPEKLNKMKVKYASQIFSRTVSSNMGHLADKGILPEECKDTADLLLFMDDIFDSVNGSFKKKRHAKPLLGPATPHSIHHKTWMDAKKVFASMKFISSSGREESIPTVTNWVWTLEGIEVLLKKLEIDFGITSVWLRHLNQDPLENFFGAVRSHGCRNINPTCDQFESAFATLLINNLSSVHTHGKNCEFDYCNALHTLIVNENSETSSTCTFDFTKILGINFTPITLKLNNPRIIAPLQYISGYFLKKAKTHIFKHCVNCKYDLTSEDEIEYIKYREYAGRRWLCTPSNDLIQSISNMQDVINHISKDNFENDQLKEIIKTSIYTLIDFDFMKCNVHKNKLVDYLINIVMRFLIFNSCKNINRILTGRKEVDDDENHFQIKAKKLRSKISKRNK